MSDGPEPTRREMPQMPAMPELPAPGPQEKRRRSSLAITMFALVTMILIFGTLFLVFPGFTIVVGCIVLLGLFHYFIWGWWLGGIIREEEQQSE